MKKKFIGTILCFVFIITIVFGTLYVIDHKRMDNNLPVVFSTWGKKYVPPVNDYPIQNGVNSDEELNNLKRSFLSAAVTNYRGKTESQSCRMIRNGCDYERRACRPN